MEYCKLLAIDIDDFSSSIVYEKNYPLGSRMVLSEKKNQESKGFTCLLVNVKTPVEV